MFVNAWERVCRFIFLGIHLASWVKYPSVVENSHTLCFLLNFYFKMIRDSQGVAENSTKRSYVSFSQVPPTVILWVDDGTVTMPGN